MRKKEFSFMRLEFLKDRWDSFGWFKRLRYKFLMKVVFPDSQIVIVEKIKRAK